MAGMKRVTLELGGNSAVIIEEDADLDAAVPRCVAGGFAHSGHLAGCYPCCKKCWLASTTTC